MKTRDITKDKRLAREAKKLYIEAFPKEERIPWWLLMLNSRRKDVDLTAWMDGDTFCGLTASVTVEGLHFLLFFAVAQPLRGKRYGSQILTRLRHTYETVVLNVETLDPTAPNYPQREKRFGFYGKNGFFDTGYHVWEVGGKFRVLSTRQQLDVPAYKKVFKKLTLGIWNVRLEREKKGE